MEQIGIMEINENKDLAYNSLTPQEKATVDNYVKTINVTDNTSIMKFGADSQNRIAGFSENILKSTMTKDSGEVGELLIDLSGKLKGFDANLESKGGLFGLFNNAKRKLENLKTKYTNLDRVIQNVEQQLVTHKNQMMKDIEMFDKLYQQNWEHYKEVCLYIVAGEQKLEELKTIELPALQKKAQETGEQIDVQAVNDLQNAINRFEKRLYDLKITKTIAVQTAPQIRLIQGNDMQLADKIESSIFTAIPLWKSQFVIALGLNNAQQALAAQQAVSDITNEMLRKNSEMLKQGTIEIAKESERSVVDVETLVEVNNNLISTIDSVIEIHRQGQEKREQGQEELQRLEGELKNKLLEGVNNE